MSLPLPIFTLLKPSTKTASDVSYMKPIKCNLSWFLEWSFEFCASMLEYR